MIRDQVLLRIKELIRRRYKKDIEIYDFNDLRQDLKLDSLDIIELNISLEEEFNMILDAEFLKDVKTVGDIINLIETYRNKN